MKQLKDKNRLVPYLLFVIFIIKFPISVFAYSDQWVYQARVAGAEMFKDMSDIEIYERLSVMKAQRVSVVEGDSELSNYFTVAQYDSEMAFISRVAKIAHSLDLKLVWYYPSLEVLTPHGEDVNHFSMFKDHPDWVQYNIDDNYTDLAQMTPNVFYGGLVFWVDPGAESAWMCHLSPYRDYFFERIQRLVTTGVDGVWIDVPLFNDIVGVWCCTNPHCRHKFELDTGMKFPTKTDLNNSTPNFRRWMIWRHTELNQFLIDINNAARKVNPNFETIIEIVTCDYNSATHQGLDGTFMGNVPGLTFCWEIDALSDDNAMRNSLPNDWYSLIAINKFCRGASTFERPCWAFTYGYEPEDAELVMAEAISAQISPYASKIPLMTTIVSPQYRARMFSFIEHYQDYIFSSKSVAKVAILYSSSSRDFSDYDFGTALYVTTSPPTSGQQWWAGDAADGVMPTNYIAEYRGWVKMLVAHHIPFDIVPIQYVDATKLQNYQAVVMPQINSLSQEKGQLLKTYVEQGGAILSTGPAPYLLNEYGVITTNPLTIQLVATNGFHNNNLLGKQYLQDTTGIAGTVQAALKKIPISARMISTTAPPTIHFELYKYNQQYILHCVNFNGIKGTFSPSPDSFNLKIQLPETKSANYIEVASPDEAYNFGKIAFEAPQSGNVVFQLSMNLYSIVIISFDEIQTTPYTVTHLPSTFDLVNNYPNPFYQSTTITLNLNIDNQVSLDIYNVLGKKVRTLMRGSYQADTYKINWDGTDDVGQKVANGIYLCHITAGIEEKTIKMSLFQQKSK